MKKLWIIVLTAAVVSFFGMAPATAATLCVEPTGAMGCYTSVSAAVAAAGAGDQIWVAPGVYYENVIVTTDDLSIQGGTYTASGAARRRGRAALPTWAPVDPTQVIIDARPNPDCSDSGEAFWIDGANNVTIANLTVRHSACNNIYSTGDNTTLHTVHSLSAGCDGANFEGEYPTVRNSYFTGNDYGIAILEGDAATIENNTLYNHEHAGIYAYNSQDSTFTRNTIDTTSWYDTSIPDWGGDGIFLDYCDSSTVSNNTIRGSAGDGIYTDYCWDMLISNNNIQASYGSGIYMEYDPEDNVLSGNSVAGCYEYGIYSDAGSSNTFSNNVVAETYYPGIEVYDDDTTITGNVVRNIFDYDCYYVSGALGTISNNQAEGGTGGTYGYGFDLYVDGMTISNNTAQFNSCDGFYINGDNNAINNNTARHNGDANGHSGIYVDGDNNLLSGNLAEMNTAYGFYIGGNNTLNDNTANTNYRTGIYLAYTNGGTLAADGNLATNNHGEGIANFASGTCSITNNTALGNRTDICDEGPADLFQTNTFATGGWNVPCCLE